MLDQVICFTESKRGLVNGYLPAGLPLQKSLKNFINGETQMMSSLEISASPSCNKWNPLCYRY
ncbi:hypothetical protein D5018_21065 [Parashewanella curva]|uniref:Uncharacterized protein n=1 Tax=Parashewanella curva TaxID=2338552 RepID=A0A3L8PQS6_9GAMM|nr:hypothetical protein D5018_21065 [Parashewanella curva]